MSGFQLVGLNEYIFIWNREPLLIASKRNVPWCVAMRTSLWSFHMIFLSPHKRTIATHSNMIAAASQLWLCAWMEDGSSKKARALQPHLKVTLQPSATSGINVFSRSVSHLSPPRPLPDGRRRLLAAAVAPFNQYGQTGTPHTSDDTVAPRATCYRNNCPPYSSPGVHTMVGASAGLNKKLVIAHGSSRYC